MTRLFILIWSLGIAVFLGLGISAKEAVIKDGETFLVKLAPADPRSLMQGDYMRLRYDIETNNAEIPKQNRGYLIMSVDADNIAAFTRWDNNTALKNGEVRLRYHKRGSRARIVPDSFLFQEGHAQYYEDAQYGVFKVKDHKHVLIGLAGENMKIIKPPKHSPDKAVPDVTEP